MKKILKMYHFKKSLFPVAIKPTKYLNAVNDNLSKPSMELG
jgi:hypothetical protein